MKSKGIGIRQRTFGVLSMLIFFLVLFQPNIVVGQTKTIEVRFSVLDKTNNKPFQFLDIKTYDMTDTTLVSTAGYSYTEGMTSIFLESGKKYMLELTVCFLKKTGKFQFEQEEDESYDKLWVDIDLIDIGDGSKSIELPTKYLDKKRKPEQLKEITVTASRIMFYHKGDTLVYRADAFVLAEGSMLDALFEQLPGVELRSNGEIYCRGRRVDNLLINGKDLFNGKKQLMLENLGAYTVKNIEVYDKTGYTSEMMGRKIDDDTQHVMDVKLKKYYASGVLANIEGGYGTHNRYLGKLFGMWYGDFASVSAYANLNNLSDSQKPGKEGEAWSNGQTGKGVVTRQNVGIIYTTANRANTWELKGDVDFAHTDNDLQENVSNQTFMFPADMFNYRWSSQRQKNIHLSTNHNYKTKIIPGTTVYVSPSFEYNKFDNLHSHLSAAFNRDLSEEISKELVNNIYEGNTSEILKSLVNRSQEKDQTTGHNVSGRLNARANTKLKENFMMTLSVDGDYKQIHSNRFREYDVRYGDNKTAPIHDYQYFNQNPDRTINVAPKILFNRYLPDFYRSDIDLSYQYSHHYNKSTSDLYRLDQMEVTPAFGVLPSMVHYRHTFDPEDSYSSRTKDDSHNIRVKYSNHSTIRINREYSFLIGLDLGISLTDRSYNYILGNTPSDILRRNILYSYSGNIEFLNSDTSKRIYISISGEPIKASLSDMVNLPHTDPLNIYVGNRSLKDSYNHTINLRFYKGREQTSHTITAGASLLQDAQARSYVMDPSTGVRTFSTHNVQGNWNANAGYNFFTAFGQFRNLDISSDTRGTFVRNVDLVGGMRRRRVSTVSVGEEVKFNWKFGSHRLSAFGDALWHRYLGKDEGFTEFSAWNMRYGVSGVIDLPHNWGISSDITMYTRQGYHDPNLNTTDVVWNARVSKSLLKGSLVLALDAYDILHQISTVSYMVNAQARTETVVNSIPSYLLFHIYYRFNKQPKKR